MDDSAVEKTPTMIYLLKFQASKQLFVKPTACTCNSYKKLDSVLSFLLFILINDRSSRS